MGVVVRREGLADAGDPGAAADLMAEALAEHPGNAHVLYNTACFEALAGRRDDAIAHLRAAVELAPKCATGPPGTATSTRSATTPSSR